MYYLPQEIEVWYILPAIRREFAKVLTGKHKLSYQKTGEILGISKAAISQYLSDKRATKMEIPDAIKKEIAFSAEIVNSNNKVVIRELERILKLIKKSKCSCDVCRKYNPEILKLCGGKPSYEN